MAIFSGNIIEAYYANSDNDTIEVIYKQGEQAINHFLKVDYNDQDFKDLIAEYDTDKIAGSTIARNRNYARQLSELVDAGIKSKTDTNEKVRVTIDDFIDSLINFKDIFVSAGKTFEYFGDNKTSSKVNASFIVSI